MYSIHRSMLLVAAAGAAGALVLFGGARSAKGFTQSGVSFGFGSAIPMGHEWISRLSALEVIGNDPVIPPDPNDPRKMWTSGKAKNVDVSSQEARAELKRIMGQPVSENAYASTYKPVLDAILGERWVDLGGMNVTKAMMTKIGTTKEKKPASRTCCGDLMGPVCAPSCCGFVMVYSGDQGRFVTTLN